MPFAFNDKKKINLRKLLKKKYKYKKTITITLTFFLFNS